MHLLARARDLDKALRPCRALLQQPAGASGRARGAQVEAPPREGNPLLEHGGAGACRAASATKAAAATVAPAQLHRADPHRLRRRPPAVQLPRAAAAVRPAVRPAVWQPAAKTAAAGTRLGVASAPKARHAAVATRRERRLHPIKIPQPLRHRPACTVDALQALAHERVAPDLAPLRLTALGA